MRKQKWFNEDCEPKAFFTYTKIRTHKIQKSLWNQPDSMLMPQVLCIIIDEKVDLLVS